MAFHRAAGTRSEIGDPALEPVVTHHEQYGGRIFHKSLPKKISIADKAAPLWALLAYLFDKV